MIDDLGWGSLDSGHPIVGGPLPYTAQLPPVAGAAQTPNKCCSQLCMCEFAAFKICTTSTLCISPQLKKHFVCGNFMQMVRSHIWLQGRVVALCLVLSPHCRKAVALIPFDFLGFACFLPWETLFSWTDHKTALQYKYESEWFFSIVSCTDAWFVLYSPPYFSPCLNQCYVIKCHVCVSNCCFL